MVKHLDPTRYDHLFRATSATGDDGSSRAAEVWVGGSGIVLGGPKYAEYEIEPGEPLVRQGSLTLD